MSGGRTGFGNGPSGGCSWWGVRGRAYEGSPGGAPGSGCRPPPGRRRCARLRGRRRCSASSAPRDRTPPRGSPEGPVSEVRTNLRTMSPRRRTTLVTAPDNPCQEHCVPLSRAVPRAPGTVRWTPGRFPRTPSSGRAVVMSHPTFTGTSVGFPSVSSLRTPPAGAGERSEALGRRGRRCRNGIRRGVARRSPMTLRRLQGSAMSDGAATFRQPRLLCSRFTGCDDRHPAVPRPGRTG